MCKIIFIITISLLASFLFLVTSVFSLPVIIFSEVFFVSIFAPHAFVLFFLLVRPAVDIYAKYSIAGINLSSILTISVIFFCIIALFKNRWFSFLRQHKFLRVFNILFCFLIFFSLFSFLHTDDYLVSFFDLLRLISLGIIFNFIVIFISNERRLNLVLNIIILSSVIPLSFGLVQFLSKTGFHELGLNRIYGSFVYTNVFAQFLFVLFFVVYYLLVCQKSKFALKSLYFLLLLLIVSELFFTYSRGTWITIAVIFLFISVYKVKLRRKFIFITATTMILIPLFPFIQNRFMNISYQGAHLSSWQWRLNQWSLSIRYLGDRPFIGNGMGVYEKRFGNMAHNDYLRIAFEAGFIALFVYLALLIYMLAFLFKRLRVEKKDIEYIRYKFAFGLMLGLAIMSLATNLMRSTIVLIYLYVVMGSLVGINTNKHLEENQKIR